MAHWTIDLARREVRDAAGGHVILRRRTLELLLYLAARHDQPISKDELIEANWRGLAVTDDSLTKCISEIRQAFGAPLRETIRTLTGRGYMLTGWHVDAATERLTGAPAEAPPKGNLPPARPLFGREEAIARIGALLGESRLVTLLGPGGVGKTSLSIGAAATAAASFPDGAWFVELAPLISDAAITTTILAALGATPGDDPRATLAAFLQGRRLLLVLDNCEHLVAGVAEIAAGLLAAAPGLTILATSREALVIDGERIVHLQPLPYPEPGGALTAREALDSPSIALLCRQAALAFEGFVLDDAGVHAAVEICRRLDGMPLAIVLAAARLDAMSLDELARSLDRRLDLLTSGPRSAGDRQRTLRAMLGWSVNLLPPDERTLFAQLGVFSAPASADDIAAVCRIGDEPPPVELILSLTSKSLLNVHRHGGTTRYGYFETTRHFALELLADDEAVAVRRRHASYLADLMQQGEAAAETTATSVLAARYRPYLDDLRAALEWTFSPGGDSGLGVLLVIKCSMMLEVLSLQPERVLWTDRAAAVARDDLPPALAARLAFARSIGDGWDIADGALAAEAATLFAAAGEPLWEGRARAAAARAVANAGLWDAVWGEFDHAARLLRPLGNTLALNDLHRYRATALLWAGRHGEAEAEAEASIAVAEAMGDRTGVVWGRRLLADIAVAGGRLADAIALEQSSLAAARGMSPTDALQSLTALAGLLLLAGDAGAAREVLREALDLDRQVTNIEAIWVHVELAAACAAQLGDLDAAAVLEAAARTHGRPRNQIARSFEAVLRERTAALLAARPASRAAAGAGAMTTAAAIAFATETLAR